MKYIVFDCDGTLIDTSNAKCQSYPGIKDLIEKLAQGNKLFVWTARDRNSTLRILKDNGLVHFFEEFATASDAALKPSMAGLLSLLGNTPKESICVIGDSSGDMRGGKAFGVLCIGAIWNREASASYLKEAGADFIVSHPSECSKLVELNLRGDEHV